MNKQGKKEKKKEKSIERARVAKIYNIFYCFVYTKWALNERLRYLLPWDTFSAYVTYDKNPL